MSDLSIRPYKGKSNLAVDAVSIFNRLTGNSLSEADALMFFAIASQNGFSKEVQPRSRVSMAGRRFGRLSVLGLSPNGFRNHWTCQCDCGSLAHVCDCNLTSGKQLSCGCLLKEVRAKVAESRRTTDEEKLVVRRRNGNRWSKTAKGRAAAHKYIDKNREVIRVRGRKYHAENPEVARASVRNRRARMRNAPGVHSRNDIEQIGLEQGWACAACDMDIAGGYHIDHVHPISKGGSNYPSNLQLLCAPCNLKKSDKSLHAFMTAMWPELYAVDKKNGDVQ